MPEALPAVTVPALSNAGLQARERLGAGLLVDELVGGEDDRVALLLRDRERHDLVLEAAAFLRRRRLLLRGEGERVLLLAADLVLLGHVLGRDAHVVLVVDVEQAVGDHRVDQLPVAHALALARAEQHVRRQAHVLLAAGDADLVVAVADRLRGEHHRLQAGAADGIDRQRRHALRQAALDHRLTRRVLARAGREHLAEDDLADLVAREPGALEQAGDHGRAELGRGGLGERAAELADRRAGGGDDDDVGAHGTLLSVDAAGTMGGTAARSAQAFSLTYRPGAGSIALFRAARLLRRRHLLAAEGPARPTSRSTSCPDARPPAQPLVGRCRQGRRGADPVAALLLERRVDHAGDVARGAEHEAATCPSAPACSGRRLARARCGLRARRRGSSADRCWRDRSARRTPSPCPP